MKKTILIVCIILSLPIIINSNDTIYKDEKIGFYFKISNNIKKIDKINRNGDWDYCFHINILSFNDPDDQIYIRYTKEKFQDNFNKENMSFIAPEESKLNNGSEFFFKYNEKTIGYVIFLMGDYKVTELFSKSIVFIKDDYLIRISVFYNDKDFKMVKRYTKYFKYPVDMGLAAWNEPISNNRKEFYNLIRTKSSNAPKELIKVEEYFDEIINSLELFDPKLIYLTPTVSNLRFRETPDLNGKFIRSLNQGEKLELLEKGKTETIGNATGTWVKVKTEKGEVGWCFDAYLEPYDEVKKK